MTAFIPNVTPASRRGSLRYVASVSPTTWPRSPVAGSTSGIGQRTQGGRVTVKAERDGDRLRLAVADDGAGLTTSATMRVGIGLSNTRERLRATFGADHRFSLDSRPDGGAIACIDIPYRLHAVVTA